jgi:hypothetical protein
MRMEDKNEDELEKLMRRDDTLKYIRTQKITWWGHLNRMGKTKKSKQDYGMEFRRDEI